MTNLLCRMGFHQWAVKPLARGRVVRQDDGTLYVAHAITYCRRCQKKWR